MILVAYTLFGYPGLSSSRTERQDTMLQRAASHCRIVMLYLWEALAVSECQLNELWSFVHTKERQYSGPKNLHSALAKVR